MCIIHNMGIITYMSIDIIQEQCHPYWSTTCSRTSDRRYRGKKEKKKRVLCRKQTLCLSVISVQKKLLCSLVFTVSIMQNKLHWMFMSMMKTAILHSTVGKSKRYLRKVVIHLYCLLLTMYSKK